MYMIVLFSVLSVLSIAGAVVSKMRRMAFLSSVFGFLTPLFVVYDCILISWHRAFSWSGKRPMARQIIDGTASYVKIPDHGVGLDIGCGSGALTIACAKKNPNAQMIGVDIWSGAWSNYSQKLCNSNAAAENVRNVTFEPGSALKLPFEDEAFDAVTSNFVYHNIHVKNRQVLLLETLRVLKKGGTFAIHDIFSKMMYGDMDSFVRKLKDMGYQDVRLISTTDGMFMTKKEARRLMLPGSALLVGQK
jgi:arsenite methyltransferase